MNKQPERTARTRQALIDSFWELYSSKDISKITIKEITTNAGFYRSTFYEYFGSVYDVLEEIENNLVDEFRNMLPQMLSARNTEEAFAHIYDMYERNGIYLAVLFGPNGDHKFTLKAIGMLRSTLASILKIPENDMHLTLAVEIISSSVLSILNYWYVNRDTVEFAEVLNAGSDILQNVALPIWKRFGVEFMER